MHFTVKNIITIQNKIKLNLKGIKVPKIIAVSKTFKKSQILPLIEYGQIDFGENKVQEAIDKWTKLKEENYKIQLHMIGKLQSNKVKLSVKLFDYIHSVDSLKLAKKIYEEQTKINKSIKIFIQVNIGSEEQKAGVSKDELRDLILFCKSVNLDVQGLMCIPPANKDCSIYFKEIELLNKFYNFLELSMGMSSDYLKAIEYQTTYLRIGSGIFGYRS